MAGYSGGRKVVAPGVAHADTIRTFHNARFMEDPFASSCNLDRNPLHEEQLEIVRTIGEIYGLNTVIDEARDLVHVTFGEIIQSHLAAVEFVRKITEIRVPRKFKTIVTSAAGYPLDKTYYQTVKGMVTPIDILEPGGTLIIASECSEGIGSPEFHASQARLVSMGPDAFLQMIQRKSLADVDEWQTEMQLKADADRARAALRLGPLRRGAARRGRRRGELDRPGRQRKRHAQRRRRGRRHSRGSLRRALLRRSPVLTRPRPGFASHKKSPAAH